MHAQIYLFQLLIYRLETSYTASFLFRSQFRRLGYAVSTLKIYGNCMSTLLILPPPPHIPVSGPPPPPTLSLSHWKPFGNEVSEWFPVRVGLRQGCVMSPWLFNLYIDGVVREVNARVLGRGLKLVDGNDNEWG